MRWNRHMLRRSIFVWSAVCVSAALAQTPPVIHMTVPLPPPLAEDAPVPEIVCRPPQPQTDSRLLGPRVCKPKQQWDDLHAQGLDISADGKSAVASEKYHSLNPRACGSTSCN
jgi:hypothetical protein